MFPGPSGSNTVYDAALSLDGTHFTPLGNTLLAKNINAIWPGKGDAVRFDQRGDRRPIVVATEVYASGSHGGSTSNTTWNARSLTSLDVDTDDVARLVYRISYSFTPGAASGLVARQRLIGGTSGAQAFVVNVSENTGAGTGLAQIVNIAGGTFTATEGLTSSGAFVGTSTSLATAEGSIYIAPGTYFAEARSIAIMCGPNKLRLINSAGTVLVAGLVSACDTTASTYGAGVAALAGTFTVSSGTQIFLQHYTTTGQASFGKGLNCGDGTTNKPAMLKLEKLN